MSARAWIVLLALVLPLALLAGAYLEDAWRRSHRPPPRTPAQPAQPTRRSLR